MFMWATVPMLDQALKLLALWGFTYKSHCVWIKDKAGTGYWFRNRHELLLVGTRGTVPAPAPGEQYDSVIELDVGSHSAKPEGFAEMIEDMFPHAVAVEMFARAPRLGWDVWGNEVAA
jgi:N6-adenosine-specific RNA methylase IME4